MTKYNIGCENFQGLARAETTEKVKLVQLRCKQWSCEYCAVANAKQWRAALIHAINTLGGDWSFWTITVPRWIHKHKDKESRYSMGLACIKKNWDPLMKRIKRRYPGAAYMRIIETHKSGAPHVHFLLNAHLDDVHQVTRKDGSQYGACAWVEDALKSLGWGFIYDIRNLAGPNDDDAKYHAGSVALYVTKYMTKDLGRDDDFRKKMRIHKIQTSRNIKRINLDSEDQYRLTGALGYQQWLEDTRVYHDVTTGQVIQDEHFKHGFIYPPDQEYIKRYNGD